MPSNWIPSRRAVVTGLGAVMPIGNDFPTYWSNLVAGVTGTRRISASTRRRSRSGSRPRSSTSTRRRSMDAKMARRMSRFIHLAMARRQGGRRATRASTSRRWTQDAARPGRRRRQHGRRRDRGRSSTAPTSTTRRARASSVAVRDAGAVGLDGRLHAVDGVRPDRPGHDPGRRVRDVGHRVPRRAAADPRRRVRRRPGRRLRGADLPMGVAALANMGALSKRNDDPRRRRGRSTRRATASSSARAPAWSSSSRSQHALERGATPIAEVIGGGADRRRVPHQRAGADRAAARRGR